MNIFHFNPETNVYQRQSLAMESPREPGVYLLPANSTFVAPPVARDGFVSVWKDSSWQVEPVEPAPESDPIPEPPVIPSERLRGSAYTAEADPIFFKWQRGEATKEEWLAKIAEIKAKYP